MPRAFCRLRLVPPLALVAALAPSDLTSPVLVLLVKMAVASVAAVAVVAAAVEVSAAVEVVVAVVAVEASTTVVAVEVVVAAAVVLPAVVVVPLPSPAPRCLSTKMGFQRALRYQ